jgi:hypothetical protein
MAKDISGAIEMIILLETNHRLLALLLTSVKEICSTGSG